MHIKVKVKDSAYQLEIFKYKLSLEDSVKKLIAYLTDDLPYLTHEVAKLRYEDYDYSQLYEMKLSKLFEAVNHVTLNSDSLTVDLSIIETKHKQLSHLNLDYSHFIKICDHYSKIIDEYNVPNGTLFYIQQQAAQYVVRKEENHLEFYNFKKQFDNAFLEDGREPFFVIDFKSRKEMSQKEIHWIKSYRYPKKEKKNPMIHIDDVRISESILNDITTLVHRVFTVIGRFKQANVSFNEVDKLPTYTELGEKVSIGYVPILQLERILQQSSDRKI